MDAYDSVVDFLNMCYEKIQSEVESVEKKSKLNKIRRAQERLMNKKAKLEEITRTGKIFTKKETNIIYILLAAIGLALVIFTGLGPAIISGSVLAVLIKVHKGNKEMMNSLGLSSTDVQSDNDFAFIDDMNLGL